MIFFGLVLLSYGWYMFMENVLLLIGNEYLNCGVFGVVFCMYVFVLFS